MLQPDPVQSPQDAASSSARVLIAEDDEEMRRLIAIVLSRDGHRVVQASDGTQLVDQVLESMKSGIPIDLVVTDVRMPGVSGFEAVSWIRDLGCRAPVVVITAFADPDLKATGTHLGVVAVLDKPFELDDLKALVRRVLAASPLGSRRDSSF